MRRNRWKFVGHTTKQHGEYLLWREQTTGQQWAYPVNYFWGTSKKKTDTAD